MTNVATLLGWGRRVLNDKDQPLLEAQILLAYVLGSDRVKIIAWPEMDVSTEHENLFKRFVERRSHNEPLAYIVGEKEFWSKSFIVTPDTLIPRPETEQLVEVVLESLPADDPLTVIDLGTGSGAIACTLASERPHWKVIGSDISEKALMVAKKNAQRLNLSNVEWRQSRWLEAFGDQKFDAIVSNPPYLRADDEHLEQGALSFEPLGALVAGKTGLECYQVIIEQAKNGLKKNGLLAFEHGYDQATALQQLLNQDHFKDIQIYKDLSGHTRVIKAHLA